VSRIRSLKPEIVQSARLAECSRDARLLFVYLISQSDCFGNQRADARLIRGQLFPYDDDITAATIEGWLGELCAIGVVQLYEVEGQRYLHLTSWHEHQVISKPGKPLVPGPDDGTPTDPQGPPGDAGGTQADLDLDLDLDLDQELLVTDHGGEPAQGVTTIGARPQVERVTAAEFDEWWERYPKKVKRRAAEAKYRTVRKAGITHDTLMAGLARSIEHWRHKQTERQFIPDPTAWLHQGRWDDDYGPARSTPPPGERKSGAELDAESRAEYERQRAEALAARAARGQAS
jgi:hypothetical protein